MSLINKMLQDLDKRHAADSGGKPLTEQLRPVAARRNWKRIVWEVGVGLVLAAGWAAWVLFQISPRPVVTDLAYRAQPGRHLIAAAPQVPAPVAVPAPPPQSAAAMPAPAAPAEATASAPADMLRLATEIGTPFEEKRFAGKPGSERRPAAESRPAAPTAGTVKSAPAPTAKAAPAQTEPAPKSPDPASIDKRVHLATPAERVESEFRKATALLNQGRVAEAIDGYKLALKQDGGHAAARQALVGLLLENRRIDEARLFLQEGLGAHPERTIYAMLLARIQVDRGDLQGAHDLLRKHAGAAAGDPDYHAFDAALLQRLGRHKEAVIGYKAALKLAPRAGLWWMGMGISLQADNLGTEALDAFQRAKSVGGLSPALVTYVDQRIKQLQ